jgi:hypothetical protein
VTAKEQLELLNERYPRTAMFVLGLFHNEISDDLHVMASSSASSATIIQRFLERMELANAYVEAMLKSIPFMAIMDLHYMERDPSVTYELWMQKWCSEYREPNEKLMRFVIDVHNV